MENAELVEKIEKLVVPFLEREGYELVEVTISGGKRKKKVQIFIDKPGGISIEDCVFVSKNISCFLDIENLFEHPYDLEISSPGIDRPLKKISDFERNRGNMVKIVGSETGYLIGKIQEVRDGSIIISPEKGEDRTIKFEDIKKAHIWVDYSELFKKNVISEKRGKSNS